MCVKCVHRKVLCRGRWLVFTNISFGAFSLACARLQVWHGITSGWASQTLSQYVTTSLCKVKWSAYEWVVRKRLNRRNVLRILATDFRTGAHLEINGVQDRRTRVTYALSANEVYVVTRVEVLCTMYVFKDIRFSETRGALLQAGCLSLQITLKAVEQDVMDSSVHTKVRQDRIRFPIRIPNTMENTNVINF